MRWLLAIGILLFAHAPAHAQLDRLDTRPYRGPGAGSFTGAVVSRQPHPSVCRIVVPNQDGVSYGSGTLVDVRDRHGLVITNWHVVHEATGPIEVIFPDGFRSQGHVHRVDRDWDLAALAVWRPQAPPVALATVVPQPGDELTIAGYGSGDYRAAAGQCTQYLAPGENLPYEMIELRAAARQGDSGGPIFNARGELAGVLFGEGDGRTCGSHVGRVRAFLAAVLPDRASRPEDEIGDLAVPGSSAAGSSAIGGTSVAPGTVAPGTSATPGMPMQSSGWTATTAGENQDSRQHSSGWAPYGAIAQGGGAMPSADHAANAGAAAPGMAGSSEPGSHTGVFEAPMEPVNAAESVYSIVSTEVSSGAAPGDALADPSSSGGAAPLPADPTTAGLQTAADPLGGAGQAGAPLTPQPATLEAPVNAPGTSLAPAAVAAPPSSAARAVPAGGPEPAPADSAGPTTEENPWWWLRTPAADFIKTVLAAFGLLSLVGHLFRVAFTKRQPSAKPG